MSVKGKLTKPKDEQDAKYAESVKKMVEVKAPKIRKSIWDVLEPYKDKSMSIQTQLHLSEIYFMRNLIEIERRTWEYVDVSSPNRWWKFWRRK